MRNEVRTLRFSRTLRAARKRVFAAFVDPAMMRRWMCPEGFQVSDVEAEAEVGGVFRLTMIGPDGAVYPVHGRYVEVRPVDVVEFTWTWEPSHPLAGVETRVRVELADAGGGTTRFVMTHAGLPTEAEADSHEAGWTQALAKLERFVEEEASR